MKASECDGVHKLEMKSDESPRAFMTRFAVALTRANRARVALGMPQMSPTGQEAAILYSQKMPPYIRETLQNHVTNMSLAGQLTYKQQADLCEGYYESRKRRSDMPLSTVLQRPKSKSGKTGNKKARTADSDEDSDECTEAGPGVAAAFVQRDPHPEHSFGGHGGPSPPKCNKCREIGHVYRDCPQNTCYNCEQKGHLASNCTAPAGAHQTRWRSVHSDRQQQYQHQPTYQQYPQQRPLHPLPQQFTAQHGYTAHPTTTTTLMDPTMSQALSQMSQVAAHLSQLCAAILPQNGQTTSGATTPTTGTQ